MSKYTIAFTAILMALFFVFSTRVDITSASNVKNGQYTQYLTSAVHDAAQEMKDGMTGDRAMPEEADRQRVTNTFFRSLSMDFGYTTSEDIERLHYYVPALVLIDTDGYYIVSNERITIDEETRLRQTISPLNTWAVSAPGFLIRYYLSEQVSVTDTSAGATHTGSPTKVFEELGAPDELRPYGFSAPGDLMEEQPDGEWVISSTDDLRDNTSDNARYFEAMRNDVIIPEMEGKIGYYVNRNNEVSASYGDLTMGYRFAMPTTKYDEWVDVLETPGCIAFLQGVPVSDSKGFLNIYAFGGGEIRKAGASTFRRGDDTADDGSDVYTHEYYSPRDVPDDAPDGYVPGNKAVALAGGEEQDISEEDRLKNRLEFVHHHWGDPMLGTGCYSVPVYHKHTAECYTIVPHQHVDVNGTLTGDAETVTAERGNGGCYTKPKYHKHTEACYRDIFHYHTGSPETGGGCYSVPVYHKHTAECYAKAAGEVHYRTENTYHTHKLPVFYYADEGDDTRTEYTENEILEAGWDISEFYIIRADASDPECCYRNVKYVKPTFKATGKRTVQCDRTYQMGASYETVTETFTAPADGEYEISTGVHTATATLSKNERLTVTIGETSTVTDASGNIIATSGERTPSNVRITLKSVIEEDAEWEFVGYSYSEGDTATKTEEIPGADGYYVYEGTLTYKDMDVAYDENGTGRSLVNSGYVFSDIMSNTCGHTQGELIETTETGDPIVAEKAGDLICGYDSKDIIGYSLGCGRIDIHDAGSEEMVQYRNGNLTADYVLSRALEEVRVVCGYEEGDISGYSLSCGKREGAFDHADLKPGEEARETEVDHYELGCGMYDGQPITAAQAAAYNAP